MRAKLGKIVRFIGYPAFYLFCLTVFAYFTFPYEKLRDRIVAGVERQDPGGSGQRLEIENLGPYWLTGLRATGVRLITTSAPSGTDDKPTKKELELDEIHARVNILPLLLGRLSVSFGGEVFDGTIEGAMSSRGTERRFELELAGIDLERISPLLPAGGLPIGGLLDGRIDFILPEQKLQKASGLVDLTIRDLFVGDGKAKIQNALALPRMNLGDLVLSAEASEGVLKLGKVAAGGKDLELGMEGKLMLRDPMSESIYDMQMRFKLADAYKTRNEVTKSLFGAPGSSMPALFEMDPKVKQSKRADGFYSWQVSGLFRAPQFLPAPLRK